MTNNQPNIILTSVVVILVLITLYFTTNALKRNYEYSQQKLEQEFQQREQNRRQLIEKETQRQAYISAKFKEHQFHCYDLQIFIKELPSDVDQEDEQETEEHQQTVEQSKSNQFLPKLSKKPYRKKELNKTQQQQQPKKAASTEPIIYLFVLVLLYLLLRAISDITQHYKEQSKGDKRNLRRCSLQVYAQMKNDRRSSKGIARTYKNIFKYFKP